MGTIDAQQATATYDCKTPGCPNESTSPVGRYSYCGHCREHRQLAVVKTEAQTHPQPSAAAVRATLQGGLEPAPRPRETNYLAELDKVKAAARAADKAKAKAVKAMQKALAAKRDADAAAEAYRQALRDATG